MKSILIKLKSENDIFPPDEFLEVLNWCHVTCTEKYVWWHKRSEIWADSESCWVFEFEDEKDETMFILKWL